MNFLTCSFLHRNITTKLQSINNSVVEYLSVDLRFNLFTFSQIKLFKSAIYVNNDLFHVPIDNEPLPCVSWQWAANLKIQAISL